MKNLHWAATVAACVISLVALVLSANPGSLTGAVSVSKPGGISNGVDFDGDGTLELECDGVTCDLDVLETGTPNMSFGDRGSNRPEITTTAGLIIAPTTTLSVETSAMDITATTTYTLAAETSIGLGSGSYGNIIFLDGVTGAVTVAGGPSNGDITLVAGTGTATVTAGARCTCTDQTAANAVQCSVSGTTLTANGTGTDVIGFHCF